MKQDLEILQGKTFSYLVRWETAPIVYKAITGITKAAPCVLTVTGHGVPDGWRVAVISVKGMTEINATNDPPKDSEYEIATVVDANTIELNKVSSANYKAYTSGGYVMYNTPVDLTGFTARMTIKDKVGGTELMALTTGNGRIVIDEANFKITLLVSATDTAAIAWKKGVYDLELESPTGVVTSLMDGKITVSLEVTT